jgi:hypothetical protein
LGSKARVRVLVTHLENEKSRFEEKGDMNQCNALKQAMEIIQISMQIIPQPCLWNIDNTWSCIQYPEELKEGQHVFLTTSQPSFPSMNVYTRGR